MILKHCKGKQKESYRQIKLTKRYVIILMSYKVTVLC